MGMRGGMGSVHMAGGGHAGGAYASGGSFHAGGHGGGAYGGGGDCGACGVSAGCGNTGCGACDQEQASLSYVGSGRGSYSAQTEYKYVGAPAKPNCFCIISLSALLCLLPLLLYWLMGSNTAQTTSLPYDCNAGLANA